MVWKSGIQYGLERRKCSLQTGTTRCNQVSKVEKSILEKILKTSVRSKKVKIVLLRRASKRSTDGAFLRESVSNNRISSGPKMYLCVRCCLAFKSKNWIFSQTWLCYVWDFAVANASVVCNVRAPYSGVETFGNISAPFCTLAIRWPPCKILRRSP